MTPDNSEPVSIFITMDEWRNITTWMHASLDRTENSPYGHFLLECDGTSRTWITSDGAQTTVMRGDGPPARGLADADDRFTVLVNSRFFRSGPPQDVTLTVSDHGDGRQQTLVADGVEITLPEHPDDYGDWRQVLESVQGAPLVVETTDLRNACSAASIVPFGIDMDGIVHTWVSIRHGHLHFETPWVGYPTTEIDVAVVGPDVADTEPTLVSISRLTSLVAPIDLEKTTIRLSSDPMAPMGISCAQYEAVLMPVDRWYDERERVEKLLCEFLGVESVTADDEGDYSVTSPEGQAMWVRLHTDADPVSAQVFCVLATDVAPSLGLLEELNSINGAIAHVKVLLAGGSVMAEVDLVAESMDLAELANALRVVRDTARDYEAVLSSYFGGVQPSPEGEEH